MIVDDIAEPAYAEYAQVREQARAERPRFPDGRYLEQLRGIERAHGHDWCTGVVGHPWRGVHDTPSAEAHMLVVADRLGLLPPIPHRIANARLQREREHAEWRAHTASVDAADARTWAIALEDSVVTDLLAVRAKSGGRRLVAGYDTGPLRHAVPTADVYSTTSRLQPPRTHPAGQGLCETRTRVKPLDLSSHPTDKPATCDRCINWTTRVRRQP